MLASERLADASPLPVPSQAYRDAMARLGAAVNLITTDGPAGRAGFTATAVCSVTDEPPTLLVCLNRSASVHAAFVRNRTLCVNTLAADQDALSRLFGGKTPLAERFAAAQWGALVTGAPVLEGALVAFDCRVLEVSRMGSHDILYAEVLAIQQGEARSGLIYFQRAYHRLGD